MFLQLVGGADYPHLMGKDDHLSMVGVADYWSLMGGADHMSLVVPVATQENDDN